MIDATLYLLEKKRKLTKSLKSTFPTHGELLATGYPQSPYNRHTATLNDVTVCGEGGLLKTADLTTVKTWTSTDLTIAGIDI